MIEDAIILEKGGSSQVQPYVSPPPPSYRTAASVVAERRKVGARRKAQGFQSTILTDQGKTLMGQ